MKIKEPFATFSSFIFAVFGLLIAGMSQDYELLSLSLIALGISSAYFHSIGSEKGSNAHRADEASIYAVLSALIYYASNESFSVLVLIAIMLVGLITNLEKANLFVIVPVLTAMYIFGLAFYVPIFPLAGYTIGIAGVMAFRKFVLQTDFVHMMFHVASGSLFFIGWHLLNTYR